MARFSQVVSARLSILLVVGVLTLAVGCAKENLQQSQVTKQGQDDLRTTPAGAVGKTNYFSSKGHLNEVSGKFNFTADKTTAYVWGKPNIMASGCDPKKLVYKTQWALLNSAGQELEAQEVTDPTTEKVMADATNRYQLRVKVMG